MFETSWKALHMQVFLCNKLKDIQYIFEIGILFYILSLPNDDLQKQRQNYVLG